MSGVGSIVYNAVSRRFSTVLLASVVGAYVFNYSLDGVTNYYWDTVRISNVKIKSLIRPTSEKTPGLKRKRSSISGRLFKKHEADENLDESGGEEEAEERGFAISKPSTSHGEAGNDAGKQLKINSISSRKGEYFVKNADGIPTEKFSMRYRNLLHR
ncbi:unnamed protein product [Caenorhabditis bovis]|uniref:Uncharacterized protein n=1 Tax=Caenorhabditis bovis TaxID=2654633 RepID=A0A8S1EI18_9PELO|nr:unnamed protein product [Caenorhabditis bovis]